MKQNTKKLFTHWQVEKIYTNEHKNKTIHDIGQLVQN